MSNKVPRFVHRKRPQIHQKLFGAFDLETFGLGGEYADGFTWEGPGTEPQRHFSVDSLFKALLNPDHGYTDNGNPSRQMFIWLAHNGAKYDFVYLANELSDYARENELTLETNQQGTKIVAITIKTPEGKVQLRDSFPLLYSGLESVSKAFAPDYAKAGDCPHHDFTVNDSFQYDPQCEVCVNYAEQDVISLWHTYDSCRSVIIRNFGVEPGITTGATAMRAWQFCIPRGAVYYRQSPRKEAWLRNFTTGAYITPGCTSRIMYPEPGEEFAAVTVDRGAAFAACQLQGKYPTDAGAWVFALDPEAAMAFYEVEAYCPVTTAPRVPLTDAAGNKAWAQGHGTAFVTSEIWDELISYGYQLKVVKGLTFDRVEDVYSTFIRKCEDMEYPGTRSCTVHKSMLLSEGGSGIPGSGECTCRKAEPAIKAIAKNMRNSLNGKTNTRSEQDSVKIGIPAEDDEEARQVVDPATGLPVPLYTKLEEVEAPYCQPAWYALTVMRQQREELRLVNLCPPGERYKCDTDSVTMSPKTARELIAEGQITIGPGYGNYKVEHEWLWHQSIGPKNYRGQDTAEYVANCKGINHKKIESDPVFIDAHARAGDGEKVQLSWDSVRSFKDMIVHDLRIPAIRRERSPGTPDTVNGWQHDRATRTFRPLYFDKAPEADAN